jgi:hypothetical protein
MISGYETALHCTIPRQISAKYMYFLVKPQILLHFQNMNQGEAFWNRRSGIDVLESTCWQRVQSISNTAIKYMHDAMGR